MDSNFNLKNLNKYQTELTVELIESLPKEVYNDIIDAINTIPFIQSLIENEEGRGFANGRVRHNELPDESDDRYYNDGRIVVDITNPHILEDMDFFREKALFHEEHGVYTFLKPNPNPKSEYANFWRDEVSKWKNGLVRKSDGEWIPGYYYFYLNYSPIWLNVIKEGYENKRKKQSDRIRAFPKVWLGDYLFYHYLDQAIGNGNHAKLLKTRGVGFAGPYSEQVVTPTGFSTYGEMNIGDKLISRNGSPTIIEDIYEQGEIDVYEVLFADGRSTRCSLEHLWSVYDRSSTFGKRNELKTISTGEMLEKGVSWLNIDDNDVFMYKVPNIQPVIYEPNELELDPYDVGYKLSFAPTERNLIKHYNEITKIPSAYKLSSVENRIRLINGIMDAIGYLDRNNVQYIANSSKQFILDVLEVLRSLGIRTIEVNPNGFDKGYDEKVEPHFTLKYRLRMYPTESLFKYSDKKNKVKIRRDVVGTNIVSIKKLDYTENSRCFLVDDPTHSYLTTDFIPTHNSYKTGSITPCSMYVHKGLPHFHLASDKSFLEGDKGIFGKVLDTLDWISAETPMPRMRMVNKISDMEVQLGYYDDYGRRRGLKSSVFGISMKDNPNKARGVRGPIIHYEEDGLFKDLETAWSVNRKAVEDGDNTAGLMISGGCLTKNNKIIDKLGRFIDADKMVKDNGILGYDGSSAIMEDINWIKPTSEKECVRIYTSGGTFIECSTDHPLLSTRPHWRKRNGGNNVVVKC